MKQPLKVLHVVNRMVLAGAETMIMNLYETIDRQEVQFDFVVHESQPGSYDERIKELGGTIYVMPKYRVFNHRAYCAAWRHFFKTHPEYSIVHGHLRSTASLYLAEAKKAGFFTIAHSHSTSNGRGLQAMIKGFLQKSIVKYSDILMGCSQEAGEWLYGNEAIKEKPFYILNNGIHLERFQFNMEKRRNIRNQYSISDNRLLLGHIGRFDVPKNHHFLVDLANKLKEEDPKTMFMFVGDGPLKSDIQKKIEDLGIEENIITVSEVKNIEDYYSAFDCFLMPSLYEGLPLTLIEAQANGLPCLVSNRITKDVDQTSLISREVIDKGIQPWSAFILSNIDLRNESQFDAQSALIKAGFDVKQNAQWLESMYQRRFQEEA